MEKLVNIGYDFRTDSNDGDVDKYSATLRKYHRILWSKHLPNGKSFNLSDTEENEYLFFQNDNQGIRLSSDWIVNTYSHRDFFKDLVKEIDEEEIVNFDKIAHTIGGYIIFPLNPINTPRGINSINQERGCNGKIADRFDLTLECIRRHYINADNPLEETLNRFSNYFEMFVDFKGFCEFFFLQDLTLDNYSKIKYFFGDFEINPYPKTEDKYRAYMNNAIIFINNRNKRIQEYVNTL